MCVAELFKSLAAPKKMLFCYSKIRCRCTGCFSLFSFTAYCVTLRAAFNIAGAQFLLQSKNLNIPSYFSCSVLDCSPPIKCIRKTRPLSHHNHSPKFRFIRCFRNGKQMLFDLSCSFSIRWLPSFL